MQQSTPEQQRALALARARKRRAESVQNMTSREAVDAMPSFLTRTAEEKAGDQFRNGQRYAAQMFGGLDDQNIRRVATYGDNFLNSATIGNAEGVNSLLDKIGVGGVSMNAPTAEDAKQRTRAFRGELREENPMSALAGEITGYMAPGTVAWKGLALAGKAVPGAAQLSNLIAKSGRVPNWLARIAGSSALFTADAGLYGATVGASNEAAMTGEDPTLASRAQTGIDYAKANVGEMGDAFGVDVPTWARGIPISMLLPAAGSVTERSIKGVQSGGKSITPDRVAAEALENVGRAPSPNSTAGAMAEVIPGERITSGTVKTFRFVENALRNGLKDAGLPAAEITDRVTRGFNSIKQSLPALADGSTTLAQLIEREFADAGPQVSENLRLFLLRVGLDDPAVTRGVIQEMRSGQVEDFRNTVNENLGSQRQYDLELSLKQGLRKIGETYDQILNKAKDLGNNSPLANSIREQLTDSKFKFELVEEASKRGWKDVDTFIKQDPWTAAHKLKSKLLSEARAAKASGNYEKYQEPAIYLREMLNELPGYQNLSKRFAEESRVLDTLGYVDTLPNGQKVSTEGFGPKLKKAARSETETLRMGDEFQAMPERQQTAAGISTGQVLKDQLRTARPGGTTLDGQDVMGLRLVDLQNEGMMSTNPEIPGALPQVFGEAGQNISQKADDIVNSRRFLADIDPNTGSNTVNKANAQMGGDAVITSGLPRTMTSGYTQSGLIDATMFASGLPPVATMLTKGIPALGRVLGPGRGTRAEIARTLMQRPARTGPPPTPPPPIAPLTGRNRPRKWRKDPKWSDPNLTNPQIEVAPAKPGLMDRIAAGGKDSERGGILGFGRKKAVSPDEFPTDSQKGSAPVADVRVEHIRMTQNLDYLPSGADPKGPIAYATTRLKETPQGNTRAATKQDLEAQIIDQETRRTLADDELSRDLTRSGLARDEGAEYYNEAVYRLRIAQLRAKGLNTSDLERQIRENQLKTMGQVERLQNKIADVEGFERRSELLPDPEQFSNPRKKPIFPNGNLKGKDSERGNIVLDGQPMRRKDVMRNLSAEQGSSFPRTAPAQASASQAPSSMARVREIGKSPLIPLLAMGGGGTAAVAGMNHFLNRPDAGRQPKEPEASPLEQAILGPSLKPDLSGPQRASVERANTEARQQDQAQRAEYWDYLKSKNDGSSTEWNQIMQARASDLKVTPEDAAQGIIRKRLPYAYDVPVSVLKDAPVEVLINGQWMPETALTAPNAQPALALQ